VSVTAIGLSLVELTFRESDGASAIDRRLERLRNTFDQPGAPDEPVSREAFSGTSGFDLAAVFEEAIQGLIFKKFADG
jgi:hypothetical protein